MGGGAATYSSGEWVGGLAHWTEEDTAYLSVAFTWRIQEAYSLAVWYAAQGFKVRAGGPGLFTRKHDLAGVAEVGGDLPDAIWRHNPMATIASRGCPVGCWFCIVPAMEGRTFTLLPDFPVRPVLCDNNLSALSDDYQQHIVDRYLAEDVPLLDANSGFEPRTFDEAVYRRWKPINKGPWRFAYDDMGDREHVRRVLEMLADEPARKKRVYVLSGNEPKEACFQRIHETIEWGGEPYCQPVMKLNALEKQPWVRHDWTLRDLRRVTRWINGRFWRYATFDEYRGNVRSSRAPDEMQGAMDL